MRHAFYVDEGETARLVMQMDTANAVFMPGDIIDFASNPDEPMPPGWYERSGCLVIMSRRFIIQEPFDYQFIQYYCEYEPKE